MRRIEDETAAGWPQAEADVPVAHDASRLDRRGAGGPGRPFRHVFRRRMRTCGSNRSSTSRRATLPPLAQQLGEALREKAAVEDRLEAVDGKIEVFEYVYETASQRSSDFVHFHRELLLEWLIVAFLAAEVLLSIATFAVNVLQYWGE